MQIVSGAMLGSIRRFRDLSADVLGWEIPRASTPEEAIERTARMLVEAPPCWERVRPFVRFDDRGYTRTVLCRSPRWELVAVGWLPGQRSAIHDHGRSSGAVLAVHGALVERRYLHRDGALSPGGTRWIHEGEVLVEHPGSIHQVENDSRAPAATLHIYLPALTRMSTFDDARR